MTCPRVSGERPRTGQRRPPPGFRDAPCDPPGTPSAVGPTCPRRRAPPARSEAASRLALVPQRDHPLAGRAERLPGRSSPSSKSPGTRRRTGPSEHSRRSPRRSRTHATSASSRSRSSQFASTPTRPSRASGQSGSTRPSGWTPNRSNSTHPGRGHPSRPAIGSTRRVTDGVAADRPPAPRDGSTAVDPALDPSRRAKRSANELLEKRIPRFRRIHSDVISFFRLN